MRNIVIALIKIYQKTLSPLIPSSCRYYPTCSNYAIQAFMKYGFIKGTGLSFIRIMRCNPLFPGGQVSGHDPGE